MAEMLMLAFSHDHMIEIFHTLHTLSRQCTWPLPLSMSQGCRNGKTASCIFSASSCLNQVQTLYRCDTCTLYWQRLFPPVFSVSRLSMCYSWVCFFFTFSRTSTNSLSFCSKNIYILLALRLIQKNRMKDLHPYPIFAWSGSVPAIQAAAFCLWGYTERLEAGEQFFQDPAALPVAFCPISFFVWPLFF